MRLLPTLGALALAFGVCLLAACDVEPVTNGSSTESDSEGNTPQLNRDVAAPDFEPGDGPADSGGEDTVADVVPDGSGEHDSGGSDVPAPDSSGEDDPAEPDLADDSSSADVNPTQLTEIAFAIESEGGFTGWGHRDYQYEDGLMVTHYPYLEPTDCSAELTADQIEALYLAAAQVDWSSLNATYWPPENPSCCCDQFSFALTADVTFVNDDPVTVASQWCTQSLDEELLPADFVSFLDALTRIGDTLIEACTGS